MGKSMDNWVKKQQTKEAGKPPPQPDDGLTRKERKEEKKRERDEKREIKKVAAKSLDAAHWTAELMSGKSSKFESAKGVTETQLATVVMGLMTPEEFKRRRTELQEAEEAKAAAAQAAAEEKPPTPAVKKARTKVNTSKLSFSVDDGEEE